MMKKICAVATALFLLSCQSLADTTAPVSMENVTEEVTFENGDVQLVATVLLPETSNGLGVVMLPGSGPATRDMLRAPGTKLTKLGYTVLTFDKRGSGESGGNWIRASLDDLAKDAIAGMNLLQARGDIDGVGFWAHSQGNWVTTRAAELGAEPAFFIAIAGGGAAPRETETYFYGHRVSGLGDADQAAAMAFVDIYFDYLSGDLPRDIFDQRLSEARQYDWFTQLGIERVLVSEANRKNWQWVGDYDPGLLAATRRFPTLVVLGGADHTIELNRTISDWNQQLAASQNTDSRIEIFVGRGHHLRLANDQGGHGVTTDDVVWSTIGQWLSGLVLSTQ